MTEAKQVRVGVGVLVFKQGQILLGKRKGAHGAATWSPPGGHMDFGENPADCAARELAEETGLRATALAAGPWTNDYFESEGKHYVTVYQLVTAFEGEPAVMEPHKCEEWRWFAFDQLPEPLFLPLQHLLETHRLQDMDCHVLV